MTYDDHAEKDRQDAAALRAENERTRKELRLQELDQALQEKEGQLRQQYAAWGEKLEQARKDTERQEAALKDVSERHLAAQREMTDLQAAKEKAERDHGAVQASIDAGLAELRAGKEILARVPAAQIALTNLEGQIRANDALLERHRQEVADAHAAMDDAEKLQRQLLQKAEDLRARETGVVTREKSVQEAEERNSAQVARAADVLAREHMITDRERKMGDREKLVDAKERTLALAQEAHTKAADALAHGRVAHAEQVAEYDRRTEALSLRERAATAREALVDAGQGRLTAAEQVAKDKADALALQEKALADQAEELRQVSLRQAARARPVDPGAAKP
jgi:hypothetical protein